MLFDEGPPQSAQDPPMQPCEKPNIEYRVDAPSSFEEKRESSLIISVLPASPRHQQTEAFLPLTVSSSGDLATPGYKGLLQTPPAVQNIPNEVSSLPRRLSLDIPDASSTAPSTECNMLFVEPTTMSPHRRTRAFTAPRTLEVPGAKAGATSDIDESSRTTLSPSSGTLSQSSSTFGEDGGLPRIHSNTNPSLFLASRTRRGRSKTGPATTGLLPSYLIAKKSSRQVLSPQGRTKENASDTPRTMMDTLSRHSVDDPTLRSFPSARLRHRWVSVLKRMFRDLAEQSDKRGQSIDKETFLDYFPLPGVLGERLFALFDKDGSQSIDFYEFFRGLSIIYNGTVEEKKKFLFDMYDLDGNRRISRAELVALLSHIPAAFRVLHHLAKPDANSTEDGNTPDAVETLQWDPPNSLEKHISSVVRNIFSDAESSTNNQSSQLSSQRNLSQQNELDDQGLTFMEFCAALEKSKEISDVLDLFYDVGMPDLPIPLEALTESCLKETEGLFYTSKPELNPDIRLTRFSPPHCLRSFLTQHHSCLRRWCSSAFSANRVTPSHTKRRDRPQSPKQTKPDSGFHTSPSGYPHEHDDAQRQDNQPSLNAEFCHIEQLSESEMRETGVVLSGWLYKVGRVFSCKRHRFYVLRDRFLYYYTSTRTPTPKNALFMQGARVSSACVTDRKNSTFALDIEFPQRHSRIHRLYAQNRAERDLWVEALTRAARTTSFHDEYVLQMPLGRGKFAVVHQGIRKRTQELVAIKIIPKDTGGKPRKAFLRTEVAVLRLLQQHPNIVRLIDVHDSAEYLYLVMEWIPGGDVGSLATQLQSHQVHSCSCNIPVTSQCRDRLITTQRVAERLAWTVARGTLLGLECLHYHNIVHRDLKPENILLVTRRILSPVSEDNSEIHQEKLSIDPPTSQTPAPFQSVECPCRTCSICCALRSLDTVKLTDFGLSTILHPRGQADEPLGTLSYAAPEVILGHPYGKSVDLWALGVVTFQLLNAYQRLPFDMSSESCLAKAIVTGECSFEPAAYWEEIPTAAKDFVRTLLRPTASSRPSASEALRHPWICDAPQQDVP